MPLVNGKYVSPTWHNGGPPALDAAELQAMTNKIEDTYAKNEVYSGIETLSPTTKTLFGLPQSATPDDAFNKVAGIPSGKGRVVLSFVDSLGPVPNVICVGLHADTSADILYSDKNGMYVLDVVPKTYTYTITWPIGYSDDTTQKSIVVVAGEAIGQEFVGTRSMGAVEIRSSERYIGVAEYASAVDISVVGGGGSGGAACSISNQWNMGAVGGAGGRTEYMLGAKKQIFSITIGAGGASVTAAGTDIDRPKGKMDGLAGGTTYVKSLAGVVVLSATGGNGGGGVVNQAGNAWLLGANGGSGSGGVDMDRVTPASSCGNSASDGGNGGVPAGGGTGGTGQGRTTRDFGEASGKLRGGAGASACIASSNYTVTPATSTGSRGDPNSGYATASYGTSTGTTYAGSGTHGYGSGGGGAVYCWWAQGSGYPRNTTSGAGGSGAAIFRAVVQ